MRVNFVRKYSFIMGVLTFALIPPEIMAHGYVMKPESRSYACKLNKNAQCGNIIYEPQSLEGANQFPQAGPADGQIASAGLSQFSTLNQQSPTRWSKNNLTSGNYDFVWQNTAMHATKSWRYFITKTGWDPNVPLARRAFDLTPFCVINGYGRQPASQVTHRCHIPNDRSGHHIILAVWDVADTVNAFYNTIDVNIIGGTNPPTPPAVPLPTTWTDIGDINPIDDLKINDRAKTRVFDENGENSRLQTEIIIRTNEQGARQIWPRLLAEAINKQHTALRAGILNSQGQIIPSNGKNDVFTSAQSGIRRVEIKLERAIENVVTPPVIPQPPAPPVPPTQPPVIPQPPIPPVPPTQPPVIPQPPTPPVPPTQPPSTTAYHHVYPENIAKYKAGTRVLASDGQIYQCKRFPYSGWCTVPAHQYVPATGSHWQDAWILVK